MSGKQRFFTRHPVNLTVKVRTPSGWQKMTTSDASRRGIFIRTNKPIPAHRIAQMKIEMPSGNVIDAMGHVRRVVAGEKGGVGGAGMGVEFFVMSKEAEDEWDGFVLSIGREQRQRPDMVTFHAGNNPDFAADLVMEMPAPRETYEHHLPKRKITLSKADPGRHVAVRGREDTRDHTGASKEATDAALDVLTDLSGGRSGKEPAIQGARLESKHRVEVDAEADGYAATSADLVDLAREALVEAAKQRAAKAAAAQPKAPPARRMDSGALSGGDAALQQDAGDASPPPLPELTAAVSKAATGPDRAPGQSAPHAPGGTPAQQPAADHAPDSGSLFITVRPRDPKHLRQFMERRLRMANVFLRSALPCFPGQRIDVAVVHPATDAEVVVAGAIARVVQGETPRESGFLMRFNDLSQDRKKALVHFINTGEPPLQASASGDVAATDRLAGLAAEHPDSPTHQLNHGWSLITNDERPVDAIDPFLAALLLRPDDVEVHLGLSLAYALAGDVAKAYAFARSSRQLSERSEGPTRGEG